MLLQGRSLNWTAKVQHRFSRNKISVQRTSEWQSVNSQVPLPPSTLLTINNIFIFHYHRSSRFLCCLLGVQKVNMACYMRVVVTWPNTRVVPKCCWCSNSTKKCVDMALNNDHKHPVLLPLAMIPLNNNRGPFITYPRPSPPLTPLLNCWLGRTEPATVTEWLAICIAQDDAVEERRRVDETAAIQMRSFFNVISGRRSQDSPPTTRTHIIDGRYKPGNRFTG